MFWSKQEEKRENDVNDWKEIYSFEKGYENGVGSSGLQESTYFSCIKIISESIAKCPLQVKKETDKGEHIVTDHPLNNKLRLRPNPNMNAVDVFKTFVALAQHEGVAGLYINRIGNEIEGLYPIKITGITIDDVGLMKSDKRNKILYDFQGVDSEYGMCFEKDIILLKGFTLDGINTRATRTLLKESLDTSIKSQNYLNSLFGNGLTNKIVVQLASDLKDEGELRKIQSKFKRLYSNDKGRVFTVPAGYQVSPLNLNLSDAQFAELRQMSKKDIAGSMGVPLSKLGETVKNAKSEEQDNLSFLVDTLQIIFTAIEQECDWKLLTESDRKKGYKIRFNTNVILRMDSLTQANVLSAYVKNGIYSLNTAKEILGIELLEKDITTFPSGQVSLDQLLNNNLSYTKNKSPDSEVGDIE